MLIVETSLLRVLLKFTTVYNICCFRRAIEMLNLKKWFLVSFPKVFHQKHIIGMKIVRGMKKILMERESFTVG